MNDEIKEILSYLKKKENTRRIKCITIEETKQLLDYITNLQQELEEEKRIEEADLKTIQRLEAENETLRSDFKNQVEYTNTIAEENERLFKEKIRYTKRFDK